MTTVKLNHEGVDVISLKVSTKGSNESHFTARHNLFNADLKYVYAVTDLNVDCSNLPIFPPNTDDILFEIKKTLSLLYPKTRGKITIVMTL